MIIFSPGPANISERVRKALLKPDINHRGPEFEKILKNVRKNLLKVIFAPKDCHAIVFTGSGTAAIESSLLALKHNKRPILVACNGVYSKRAYEIALSNGINVHKQDFPINEPIDLKKFKQTVKKVKPFATYLVHHETGTGLLNPLKDLAEIAKEEGSLVMVDTISSIAGEELMISEWGLDLVIGSANKCIRGTPGLSFAVASEKFIDNCEKGNAYYLNLLNHLEYEDKGQTPFTPAVQTFYALEEALEELVEEGVENRIKNYVKIAELLRTGLKGLGLQLYLNDNLLSNTMTTVLLPAGISYEYLYNECRKCGYEIYAPITELKDKAFRIGIVGCISEDDIKDFLSQLKRILGYKG